MIFDNRNEMEVATKICQKPFKHCISGYQQYGFHIVGRSVGRVGVRVLGGTFISKMAALHQPRSPQEAAPSSANGR